ncbi:DUF2924 domain-containing protein [Roseovarius aestuariivivens]|uniref:DUF2924 domain-containing protein n=1 Tax=Roseovarius aestuariivivens TaxID=1888910 RepID=UPI00108154E4|nr:DUF2924 domain-containing protein [Roseovarius aestuariivivens]
MPGRPDPDRPLAIAAWEEAFGSSPPPYLSVAFLRKAVAHEEQSRVSGGLSAATRRTLRQIAEGRPVTEAGSSDLRAGSHLVREWNGRTYLVEVTDGGFRLDGKDWPSLSAIAKHITGTTWSGPRFFGLTRRRVSSR